MVSTYAGDGNRGFANGPALTASFYELRGVAVDKNGNMYVASNDIRKISADGIVSTLAGDGTNGFRDGFGNNAKFYAPYGVAVDAYGSVYVADAVNNRIRKITTAGDVSTLAGSGTRGFADGVGASAKFDYPTGITVDKFGNVFVTDHFNHRIRKITPAGMVSTIAGDGSIGFVDGTGVTAKFREPNYVAVDAHGNLFVTDNNSIRKITPAGLVITLAGNGTYGFADGIGAEARFGPPTGIAVDVNGNIYVAEANDRIRKVTAAGMVSTLAGNGTEGFADGIGTSAKFDSPQGVAVDASGNVFVADTYNYRIRKITIQ
jgi:sugar lactone lactonase YvrE